MLDPFLPEKPEDVERLKAIQREIHETFIDLVQAAPGAEARRSGRIACSPANTGARKTALGLRPGRSHRRSALVPARALSARRCSPRWYRSSAACSAGGRRRACGRIDEIWNRSGFADEIVSAIETRAMWARYGLDRRRPRFVGALQRRACEMAPLSFHRSSQARWACSARSRSPGSRSRNGAA